MKMGWTIVQTRRCSLSRRLLDWRHTTTEYSLHDGRITVAQRTGQDFLWTIPSFILVLMNGMFTILRINALHTVILWCGGRLELFGMVRFVRVGKQILDINIMDILYIVLAIKH